MPQGETVRPRGSDLTYRGVVALFRLLFAVLGVRFEIHGFQHLPARGPAVLASNHVGFLDFASLGRAALLRPRLIRFLAKRAAFDSPLSGPLMRRMGHISVDRRAGAVAYRQAARALRAGEIVGVFPEATISRAWTLKPFKLGAATLAVREQVPLIPAVVWGSHRIATVDRRPSLRRGIAVTVLIGEPISAPAILDVQAVDRELRRRMQELLDVAQLGYPQFPRDAADRWWLPRSTGGTAPDPVEAAALDAEGVRRGDAPRRSRGSVRQGTSSPRPT